MSAEPHHILLKGQMPITESHSNATFPFIWSTPNDSTKLHPEVCHLSFPNCSSSTGYIVGLPVIYPWLFFTSTYALHC